MRRRLHQCTAVQSSIKCEGELGQWLSTQAGQFGLTHLLVHTDDGVHWGKFDSQGRLLFPRQNPLSSPITLQTVRSFGESAEVTLWQAENNLWEACVIGEIKPPMSNRQPEHFAQAFDEPFILWGTHAEPPQNGFTLMSDGNQGLCHTVPLVLQKQDYTEKKRPLRLRVRHYLREDDFGVVYIAASRLVGLSEEGEKS